MLKILAFFVIVGAMFAEGIFGIRYLCFKLLENAELEPVNKKSYKRKKQIDVTEDTEIGK